MYEILYHIEIKDITIHFVFTMCITVSTGQCSRGTRFLTIPAPPST